MTEADRLERDLATWLDDAAVPSVPDYVTDIVREATRHRQRPRWTFVERWWPTWIGRPQVRRGRRVAWSSALFVVLALALLLAAIAIVGSQPRVPAPFGPAQNGLIAFVRGGELVTYDPATGLEGQLQIGPGLEDDPTWSLDGMRFAFIRRDPTGNVMGFADRDGGRPVYADEPLVDIDTDSVAWSPTGREVALNAGPYSYRSIVIVNALDGRMSPLDVIGPDLESYWRPPDGRELLVSTRGEAAGTYLYSLDDGSRKLLWPGNGEAARPRGFSPDGKLVVIATTIDSEWGLSTHIVDVDSGKAIVEIDAGAGRLSNDGTRVAAYRLDPFDPVLCVAPASGGRCRYIGERRYEPDVFHGDALNWAPNDDWVMVYPAAGGQVVLIDPDGIEDDIVIEADSPGSWQRIALP